MLDAFFEEEKAEHGKEGSVVDEDIAGAAGIDADLETGFDSAPIYRRPFRLYVSGIYKSQTYRISKRTPYQPGSSKNRYNRFIKMELRLDVDGRYPQMKASGVIHKNAFSKRIHWIADLKGSGRNRWTGRIWFVKGANRSFSYNRVDISVPIKNIFRRRYADIYFRNSEGKTGPYRLYYDSSYFRSVEFEYDVVDGSDRITQYNTHAHPNRPEDLRNETLTIETVYRRAGFNVFKSGEDNVVPITLSGDNFWSEAELHNAMQTYWSKYAHTAQWSMWTVFAGVHSGGAAGIMFDDIGPNHRQGTAVFSNNSLFDADPGDPAPEAFRDRYIFWCACHEMGHCFNLAHSWQKEYPYFGNPWCDRLENEPDALSFMNYPFYYPVGYLNSYGTDDYFADFRWRFSDQELLFLRHAPEQYVQMGNADWFDDHGLNYADISPCPDLKLSLRLNRYKPVFEFMETIAVEFKLSNVSTTPQIIDENALKEFDNLVIVIQKKGKPARQFIPFSRVDFLPAKKALEPGQSMYEAHMVSAGRNGWDLSEPGDYTLQAVMKLESGEDIVSNQLHLRILPPNSFEEEHIAQDYFSQDVGRVLVFEGAPQLFQANNTLLELVDRMPSSRAAVLAGYALANPASMDFKALHLPDSLDTMRPLSGQGAGFKTGKADYAAARELMNTAINTKGNQAADTLGHIRYRSFAENFAKRAIMADDAKTADDVVNRLHDTLKKRNVPDRFLAEIKMFEKQMFD